ncbi:ATP/GTP-binding protein [Vibrio splendidus]
MLLTYAVENYKGIATKQTLDFVATQKNEFEDHLANITSTLRVNTGVCITGANGTGKTHLLESLDLLAEVVGHARHDLDIKPFLLDLNSRNKPTSFEVLLYSDKLKELLNYSLSIFNHKVVAESLYVKSIEKGSQNRKIFERDESKITLGPKLKSSQEMINSTVDSGSTLISYAKGLKIEQIKETFNILRSIFSFNPMAVTEIGPGFINYLLFRDGEVSQENQDKLYIKRNKLLDLSVSLLKTYDIPIESVKIKKNDSGDSYLIISPRTLCNNEINLTFEEAKDYFSDGTFKTILLVILISLMSNCQRIILLDEIDGSLNYKLSLEIIKMMRVSHKPINSQFILSTHDILLLDYEFRRDSIFMTSKGENLETHVARISEFSLRKDAKISSKYIANEFGALPKILRSESELALDNLTGESND